MQSFQLSSPCGFVEGVNSSQLLCVTICRVYYQPRKFTSAFGVQSFYWDSIPYRLHDWPLLSSFSLRWGHFLWSPVPPRTRTDTTWTKGPNMNHTVRLSSGQSPQANKDTSMRQDIPDAQRSPSNSWRRRPGSPLDKVNSSLARRVQKCRIWKDQGGLE